MQQNLCLVELRKCALSYFEIHLTQDNKNQKKLQLNKKVA